MHNAKMHICCLNFRLSTTFTSCPNNSLICINYNSH